ncbi:MAG: hypothetical protein ACYTHM_13025 [Planctomycetota bacterium]|jgi:hypothetical protein
MKRIFWYSGIGVACLGVVVFFTYSALSAAGVSKGPLASFAVTDWSPTAGCIPSEDGIPVSESVSSSRPAWTNAVRSVLARIEEMEKELEVYSAQLEVIEKEEEDARMAAVLALDEKSPGKALESFMGRFKKMVDAYEVMDPAAKADLTGLACEDQVQTLTSVAEQEEEITAYFDKLAERHKAHVEMQEKQKQAVFDVVTEIVVRTQAWMREAQRLHEAKVQAAKKAESQTVDKAPKAEAAPTEPPASENPKETEEQDPGPLGEKK